MMTYISPEDRQRIEHLPAWARQLIRQLELANKPMLDRCVQVERKNNGLTELSRKLKDSNEALMEILRLAANCRGDYPADSRRD